MIADVENAVMTSLQMFRDGIEKIPDEAWRTGTDDYLVPARLAHHILCGLEWMASRLPARQHIQSCRFPMDDWKGPVENLPGKQEALDGVDWVTARITDWFAEWSQHAASGNDVSGDMEKALYFMRHTQHHIGEFAAAMRMLHLEGPSWIYLKRTPDFVNKNGKHTSK